MHNDIVRTALISTLNKFFPVLVIIGVVTLTDVQTAIIMSFIGDFVTLLFLVFKSGQQGSNTTSAVAVSVSTTPEPTTGEGPPTTLRP